MTQRVLVLDDDQAIRRVLRDILTENGFDAMVCETVAEAMAALTDETFDLVITDLRMPKRDGYDFLQHIEKLDGVHERGQPVLVITGCQPEEVSKNISIKKLSRGFILYKPFRRQEFLAAINNVLRYEVL